jgi:hypothetical protein
MLLHVQSRFHFSANVTAVDTILHDVPFAYRPFPLIRHRVAQAGQGILTNMFEHVAA